jgi:uncharacterized DUF497 family protein
MVELQRITGFEWDAGNARKSADKHAVSQAQAEQLFFRQPLWIAADTKHSQQEERFHALGETAEGRLLHVTFTLREQGTKIRIISARDMSRRERRLYEQAS